MYQYSFKKCVLIRHGETTGNREGRYIGRGSDVSLSDEGRKQSVLISDFYKSYFEGQKIRLFSSPMKRTTETAAILFPDMVPETVDAFSEIDFGEFEGRNHAELDGDEVYQAWIDSGGILSFPGGEDREGYIKRVMQGFYKAIESTDPSETMIIVCHSGTIRAILSSLTEEDYFNLSSGNLEGYILEFSYYNKTISDLSYRSLTFGDVT